MEKKDLFLFNASSSIGKVLMDKPLRGFRIHAWTDQAAVDDAGSLSGKAEVHAVSLDYAASLAGEAAAASHVVLTADCLFRAGDGTELRHWANIVKKCYDACCQGKTRVFVFISNVEVNAKEARLSPKKAVGKNLSAEAQTAFEIESYLLNASAEQDLKPFILRMGMPYGGTSCVGVFEIFQAVSCFAMLSSGVPALSSSGGMPVIHVEEAARAVLFLLDEQRRDECIFHLVEKTVPTRASVFAQAAQYVALPTWKARLDLRKRVLVTFWLAARKMGFSVSVRLFVSRLWKQVCKSYGLCLTPAPSPDVIFEKKGMAKVSCRHLEKWGFARTRPELGECIGEVYDDYCQKRLLPDMRFEPQRSEALVNRVSFEQRWKGEAIDAGDGTATPVVLRFYTEMPLWESYCFGKPLVQGTFMMESRVKVSVEWTRERTTWADVFSLDDVAFEIRVGTNVYRFSVVQKCKKSFPAVDFVIADDAGKPRFSGRLTLDLSPKALLDLANGIEFVK